MRHKIIFFDLGSDEKNVKSLQRLFDEVSVWSDSVAGGRCK